MALLAAAGSSQAQQPSAPRSADDRQSQCTDRGGAVVAECVQALEDADEHVDEYMRRRAEERASKAMAAANAPFVQRDQERAAAQAEARQRAQDAKAGKLRAEARAAWEKGCRNRGLTPGAVSVGMLAADVVACGWGAPDSVSRLTDAAGVHEVWFYDRSGRWAVHVTNGIVTAKRDTLFRP